MQRAVRAEPLRLLSLTIPQPHRPRRVAQTARYHPRVPSVSDLASLHLVSVRVVVYGVKLPGKQSSIFKVDGDVAPRIGERERIRLSSEVLHGKTPPVPRAHRTNGIATAAVTTRRGARRATRRARSVLASHPRKAVKAFTLSRASVAQARVAALHRPMRIQREAPIRGEISKSRERVVLRTNPL